MKLQPQYFDKISNGEKNIETRLFDEKRQMIQLGDIIEFLKEPELIQQVRARVIGLLHYSNFESLINDFDIKKFGSDDPDKFLEDLHKYYPPEKETKHSVLGIRIQLI